MQSIDHIVSKLTTRLINQYFTDILPLEGLIFLPISAKNNIQKLYYNKKISSLRRFNSTHLTKVRAQAIKLCHNLWRGSQKTRLQLFRHNTVAVLIQILGIVPVTTATAERSFSMLRRLKTYLRRLKTHWSGLSQ